jgi:cation diffusion facilitator CzcD-associated flavoprotein CzcO
MMTLPVTAWCGIWFGLAGLLYFSLYSFLAKCLVVAVALGWAYTKLPPSKINDPPSVVIVGFGFSGIEMAVQLKRRGVPFKVYEKAPSLGGVWWHNQYPGVACDSLSHTYAFSYEMNSEWSRSFPPGAEIRAYMEGVARKHGVLEHVQFNHEVVGAQWSDEEMQWHVQVRNKAGAVSKECTQVLLSAIGVFHKPQPISLDVSKFQGQVIASMNWDPNFDCTGKTVAVVGTGASSIQMVPRLAERAKKVVVFQRSPAWIIPKTDFDYTPWIRWAFRNVPLLLRLHRWMLFLVVEFTMTFVFNDESEKKTIPLLAQRGMARLNSWIVSGLPEEWQKSLVPDYLLGCKRVIISSDYLQAFYRENVTLVPKAVSSLAGNSVIASDGEKVEADVVLCATGFDLLHHPTAEVIVGRNGAKLVDSFNEEPLLYQGVVAPGFPNLFVMFGPGSLNGFSGVMQIERQSVYVVKMIEAMARKRLAAVEITKAATYTYFTQAQVRLQKTPLAGQCTSYYRNKNGVVWSHIPGGSFENMWVNSHVKWDDYACTKRQP